MDIHRQMLEQESGDRYAANHRMGASTLAREDARAVWFPLRLDSLWQDLRVGLRMLRRSPGFSALAIFCLSLGIGANAAVFSWIEGILFRPYPLVAHQERLIMSRGLTLTAAGILFGAAVAFVLTRLLGNLLFQVSPRDPLAFAFAFASAFIVMTFAALAACFLPPGAPPAPTPPASSATNRRRPASPRATNVAAACKLPLPRLFLRSYANADLHLHVTRKKGREQSPPLQSSSMFRFI
jgi:hypothetical protein